MKSFSEFSLTSSSQQALKAMNFITPTPIQAMVIPSALLGRDIIGCAETGTGKTAAFLLPMITSLLRNNRQTGLILVPTRELAAQVTSMFRDLTKFSPELKAATLIGGESMYQQIRELKKGCCVIVATPGRLLDHVGRRTISLDEVGVLVLDEADRMLDLGFAPQLKRIMEFVPKKRQTMLFSATFDKSVMEIARSYLNDPEECRVSKDPVPVKIDQAMKQVRQDQKNDALLFELKEREGSVLIFTRTKSRADRLSRFLEKSGVVSARIHGGRSQSQRTFALESFRKSKVRILVATDIAARGLDIDHVAHVINYDLPQAPEDYVHRIGRTARAGRSGQALSFVSQEETSAWRQITRILTRSGKYELHMTGGTGITLGGKDNSPGFETHRSESPRGESARSDAPRGRRWGGRRFGRSSQGGRRGRPSRPMHPRAR